MERFILLLLLTIFTFHSLNRSEATQSDCGIDGNENDLLSFSVTHRRNESGEWITWFSASRNTSNVTNNIDVSLVRSSTTCRGNRFINIKGSIKDLPKELDRRLFFHKKCSNSAAITNDGRTLQRISIGGASARTHRPLMDDEVFTVRFDKMRGKGYPGLGIGITTHSPDDFDFPDNMYKLKSGTWMLYGTNIYQNSTLIRQDFLQTSLKRDVKIGQTIGVMKSKYGTLHFFLDGVDLGPAASNIPDTVYGVFQVYNDSSEGTIVDTQ